MTTSTLEFFQKDVLRGQLLNDELLADYTTWRVGGRAKRLYKPADIADIVEFMKSIPHDEKIFWLGLGSNSLIRDTGFSGTVILTQGNLNIIELIGDNLIRVEAGVSCAKMARFCARCDLSGGEFWAGIPGTMGGALRLNAGCYNGETWDRVIEVETITRNGEIRRRKPEEFNVSYRHVEGLAEDEWFISAICKLESGEKQQSLQTIKELLARRALTQPTNTYNCGSVFRNPPDHYAAQLIESCGLKGQRLGGAVISTKHANFIVNDEGTACAEDIESLIKLVEHDVYKQKNISLLREVHIIGDEYDKTR